MEGRETEWKLQNLPPDIWAYVTRLIPGEQLGRLKRTGSKSLWRLLTAHNAVQSINLGNEFIVFETWPAFLNEFPSIQELSITIPYLDWWCKLGARLSMMPRTLRKLQFLGSIRNFHTFFQSPNGDLLFLDEQLPCLQELDCKFQMSDYRWASRLPSTLTKLSIHSCPLGVELPPSLLHFAVESHPCASSSPKLPPGLETIQAYSIHDMSLLLPPLTSLEVYRFQDLYGPRVPFDCLPHTLTKIRLQEEISSSLWPSLPATLKSLSLPFRPHYASSRKIVINPTTGAYRELAFVPFEYLPRSITFLEFQGSNFLIDLPSESNSAFPPDLAILKLPFLHISPNAASYLPASLTHLEIFNLCLLVCKKLPNGLRHLRTQATMMSPELKHFLPQSLTVLDLKSVSNYNRWFDYNSGEEVRHVTALPEFSTHEKCDWIDDEPFPPQMVQLNLIGFSNLRDDVVNQLQKVPNLLELNLSFRLTDLAIPLLGRHLSQLRLYNADITGKCFPSLPRSLIDLYLPNSSSIFDDDIQHLPRNLRYLCISKATDLTNQCVKTLPRRLENLRIDLNVRITRACFQDLPYPLKSKFLYHSFEAGSWKILSGEIWKV